jgi:hypothetical protein
MVDVLGWLLPGPQKKEAFFSLRFAGLPEHAEALRRLRRALRAVYIAPNLSVDLREPGQTRHWRGEENVRCLLLGATYRSSALSGQP